MLPESSAAVPADEMVLIRRLQARDEAAMNDFYDRYGLTLYHVIRAFVAQPTVAETVLQECLVAIWNDFPAYDPAHGRLYAWAVHLCRHRALAYLRASRGDGPEQG